MNIQTHTAIQGVCAWHNLQQLSDGRLLAFIFNQPCHAKWEGDLDCWASDDGGETWQLHACPAPHKPGTNRMNCAVGFATNGDLIVLCSGWSDRLPPEQPTEWREDIVPLNPWTCLSADGGHTWSITDDFPVQPHGRAYTPFGNISVGQDGHLRAFVYGRTAENDQGVSHINSYFTRSTDDGCTWDEPQLLNPGGNETTGLHLSDGKWLAISREPVHANVRAQHVRRFTSEDEQETSETFKGDGHGGGDAFIMAELYQTMTMDQPPRCSGDEGMESAVVALAIDEAAREGRLVHLDPVWSRLHR